MHSISNSGDGVFGRVQLSEYIETGFVDKSVPQSTSMTLNYYVADAAIARAAGILGKHKDEELLTARSKRYDVIFDKKSKFFLSLDHKDPSKQTASIQTNSHLDQFTEAGPWQYRFYVPHDVEGLNKLYEGKLCDHIKDMMEYDTKGIGDITPDSKLLPGFGLYTHGNQPVHHILYVAQKAGCNDVAEKYLRKAMQELYTTKGWAGDEDNGEMASWYILSALGVFSLEGAKDELVLGSPAVKHARVQLPKNKVLTIATENQASDNVYVQSVTWTPTAGSARNLTSNVIKYTEIMRGGTLVFVMGSSPRPKALTPALLQETQQHAVYEVSDTGNLQNAAHISDQPASGRFLEHMMMRSKQTE